MSCARSLGNLLALLALCAVPMRLHAQTAAAEGERKPVSFMRDVRPILARNCFPCHGPDESHRKSGLRLDTREGVFADREGGRPFVPGSSAESEAFRRITSDDPDERMPPDSEAKRLTPEQVELLRRWIDQGAKWESHWAFEAPVRPGLPPVRDASWPRNAIDRFVLARLEAEGLKPSPEADRHTLIRRVSLDLTGLPPSPEMVERFDGDGSPGAYERLVDELLQSPAYGERWGRLWLDLARFADTKGYEKDLRRTNFRYRDWVIDALNADMPYDRFTIEQLAGDLLPDAAPSQVLATAFHRNTLNNDEGGTDDEEFRIAAVKDRVDTTLQVWMGLTMGCAKCHTHKYDPISHGDYYRFYALFNQTEDSDKPDDRPVVAFPTADQQALIDRLRAEAARLESAAKGAPDKPTKDEIARLRKEADAIVASVLTPVMRELPENRRRETRIHRRGNFLDPGDVVTPATLASFNSLPKGAPANRLGAARWLLDPANPLTARVAVNRQWSQFFGRGLVETQEDFGAQGQPPSHPELLDWLAVEFREAGWSMKSLCRLIVTSAAYRQSSRVTPELARRDRFNRLLARGPRFRMEAEMIRDAALSASGLLSLKMFGPSVMPYQPEGIWRSTYNSETWQVSPGEDRHRRGLYTFVKRTSPYPAMLVFDAPSRETCTIRRVNTNTPLQALVTLNDAVYTEAAQAMARRAVAEGGASTAGRIAFALRRALVRPARTREVELLVQLYERRLAHYRRDPSGATRLSTEPLGPLPDGWSHAEMAALVSVCNVILNLDEFLTRG